MVRHIHNSLTKTENGEERYMTPREVMSGEKPEYIFAPIPCFDMAKLRQDIMAQDPPKKPKCNIEGTTTLCTTIENLIKLELMKSDKGKFVYLVKMGFFA